MGWHVEHRRGSASELHGLELDLSRRSVWVFHVDGPAVVLGSTQHDRVLDRGALDRGAYQLVGRRSGGGMVVLEPAAQLWVDVTVPVHDALWRADVGEAFGWLGDCWRSALAGQFPDAVVHRGPMRRRAEGAVVCFAGLGAGEVTVGERKVVGISQRRTRAGARFQCMAPATFDVARHLELLGPGDRPAGLDAVLRDHVGTVSGLDRVLDALVDAVVAAG